MNNTVNTVKISIIIISYNNSDLLRKTLNSIIESDINPNYEIIVVDNASFENNIQMMRANYPQVKVIENKINKGFARACNQAAKLANGEHLMFVNSDINFEGDPFNKLVSAIQSDASLGLLGSMLLNMDGSPQPSYYGFPKLSKRFIELVGLKKVILIFLKIKPLVKNQINYVDIVKGAFFLIKKNLFASIDGFDEDYFMYVEDADLSFRVTKLGFRNAIINSGVVFHSGEHHESPLNRFIFYYRNKGLLNFYKKNYNRVIYYSFILINIFFFNIKFHLAKFKKNITLAKNYRIVYRLYLKYFKS